MYFVYCIMCFYIATIIFIQLSAIRRVNIRCTPKKIAKVCFLVVLCQVGSTLQHTKSWTNLEYGKCPNSEMTFFSIFKPFSIYMFNCNSVSFHDKSVKLAFLPRFSGSVFHMRGLLVMLNHSLYHIQGYPYLNSFAAPTPIHKRLCTS